MRKSVIEEKHRQQLSEFMPLFKDDEEENKSQTLALDDISKSSEFYKIPKILLIGKFQQGKSSFIKNFSND